MRSNWNYHLRDFSTLGRTPAYTEGDLANERRVIRGLVHHALEAREIVRRSLTKDSSRKK